MRTELKIIIAVFALFASMTSCHTGKGAKGDDKGDTVALRHSQLLTIVKHADYTEVSVANPWDKGNTLHRYALVPKGKKQKAIHGCTTVRVPLQHSVVFTTVHCALLAELGALDAIAGVCDKQYIKTEAVKARCSDGTIADCGSAFTPDMEKIVGVGADALLLSPFENSGGYGKLESLSIPIIECAEYMEKSALGRAEWIKFFALLYGKEETADSIFNVVETNYNEIKTKASWSKEKSRWKNSEGTPRRPLVMIDKPTGGVWYVAGGQSTIARLIRDAGGMYLYAADEHSGSVALSVEAVVDRCHNADVWIYRYNGSGDRLTANDLTNLFQAYRQHNVWGCDVSSSLFYELTPFHPDLLLREFYNIFYDEGEGEGYDNAGGKAKGQENDKGNGNAEINGNAERQGNNKNNGKAEVDGKNKGGRKSETDINSKKMFFFS